MLFGLWQSATILPRLMSLIGKSQDAVALVNANRLIGNQPVHALGGQTHGQDFRNMKCATPGAISDLMPA
jgi:hypothetical protein